MARLVPHTDSEGLDLLPVIQGCDTACANLSEHNAPRHRTIGTLEDVEPFLRCINKLLSPKGAVVKLSREEIQAAMAAWNQAEEERL